MLVHIGEGYFINKERVQFICPNEKMGVIDIIFGPNHTALCIPYNLLEFMKSQLEK